MTEKGNPQIRILIVDDHPVVCSGLRSMLSAHADLKVGALAANGKQALAAVQQDRFDVMLLDLRMPGMDGIAVLHKLSEIKDPPRVIVLTSFEKEEDIYRAIRAGAQGYLLKDSSEAEMLAAIRAVFEGDHYIPRNISVLLANRMKRKDLSSREFEVLDLMAQGSTNKQIASALSISDNTVRCHINNIMEKRSCWN